MVSSLGHGVVVVGWHRRVNVVCGWVNLEICVGTGVLTGLPLAHDVATSWALSLVRGPRCTFLVGVVSKVATDGTLTVRP